MSITFYVQDDLRQANSQFWGRIFGLSIQSGRKKKAYSVEEAARLAGMEWSAWLAVEAGCVPDPAQLHPMSDALGLRHDKIATLAFICQGAWEV
jgi:hypothetical protein